MKLHRWFVALFVVALTITSLGFVKFQQIQAAMAMAAAFPEPSAAVKAEITEKTDHQNFYQVTGQTQATQVVSLQNELAGKITKVNFQAGDFVQKGQLLLSLDVSQEQAQLKAAKANLSLATSTLSRIARLLKQKKVSEQEYDNANAQLAIAQSEVDNLKSIINKKQLRAPFAGQVGLETYQVGQYLPMNSVITTLIGQEPTLWVDFQVAQTQQHLAVGEKVVVQAIGNNKLDSVEATIIAVNSEIKSQSRHLQYRAAIENGARHFKHNEIVQVHIYELKNSVVLVPNSAVTRSHKGTYLYALNKDEQGNYRAKRIPVELGKRDASQHIVLSGIDEGQLIATEGAFKLREGLLVYPQTDQTHVVTLAGALGKGE